MNNKICTTKQELLKILSDAFDKGWQGYLDLKEDVITKIADDFINGHQSSLRKETSDTIVSQEVSTIDWNAPIWRILAPEWRLYGNRITVAPDWEYNGHMPNWEYNSDGATYFFRM